VSLAGVRLAGWDSAHALDFVVFAGGAPDVRHVLVDGREIVRDGRHASIDVASHLHDAIRALLP
jgi:cytosine/adenosine deaminase-related metal-dependent hydrolase